jgi:hypothetical protein
MKDNYKFKFTTTNLPQRHGYNQHVYCNLYIHGQQYQLDGVCVCVANDGNIVEDISIRRFNIATGTETTSELDSVMGDNGMAVIQQIETICKSYIDLNISEGTLI